MRFQLLCYNILTRARLVLVLMLLTPAAWAHPHSFVRMQTTLLVQEGQLTGLRMVWSMDEITSADLLYDAGKAPAGSPVWKKLAAEVMANVLSQHYFTEFWHQGRPVKFKALPGEYQLSRNGLHAVLTFELPLAHPQPLAGQTYTFMTFDPTYFVDMAYENEQALHLPPQNTGCRLTVHSPVPDASLQAWALALDKADAPPESMALGKQFAQTVKLSCQ